MHALCARINKALNSGPLVLASIITQSGSAPRTAGARMLVVPDRPIQGTIGGGRYEAESLSLALELLKKPPAQPDSHKIPAYAVFFALNSASDMDMICGGDVLVLLELISPTAHNIDLFSAAAEAERNDAAFILASRLDFEEKELFALSGQEPGVGCTEREMFIQGRQYPGLSTDFKNTLEEAYVVNAPFIRNLAGASWLFEPFLPAERIHIFGAGHVSLALARLAADTGFSSSVIDDRAEFANSTRFPHSQLLRPPSLKESEIGSYFAQSNPGGRDAIVIVTRGHAFDRDALAAALRTDAGYIGMIGSSPKRRQVYASLLESGFTEQDLSRVFSPIGLSIRAETPEEIAVSIMAQLIQWRHGALK